MTIGEQPPRLEWTEVARRLHAERTIWLTTVRADDAPHAAPVWLSAFANAIFVFTSGRSVKARNLSRNPQAVLHTGDAEDVLVVSGQLRLVGHPREFPDVMASFSEKYQQPSDAAFLPDRDDTADSLYQLTPAGAMAWNLEHFYGSQRRWSAT